MTYVWELWANISKTVRFTSVPKDPLTQTNYIYGTTSDYRYYQVASILEWDTAYTPIINTTYANTETAKVEWNYPGFIKFNSWANNEESRIANIPSLIFNNTGSVSDLLANTTYFVVNKKSNLPYNTKWIKDTSIQKLDWNNLIREITWTGTASLMWVNISNLKESNFETIFTWTTLASFNVSGWDLSNKETIVSSLKTSILGTSATTATSPTNSCITQPTYSWATFTFWTPTSPNLEWQWTSSTWACYYTCWAWKVLDDNVCVSETCAWTTPDWTAKVSNATSFAGWTWNYNPTWAKCSYTCGTWYHTEDSWVSCILDQSNPTNLSLTHSTRSKTFTFSWTAWVWNWWSCKLQYNKNWTWTNISETTYNCDNTLSNQSVTLPWDWWYSWNWNWVQVRIIRSSDSTVLWTLWSLLCSTTSWSTSSTPSIDEDCNWVWDNFDWNKWYYNFTLNGKSKSGYTVNVICVSRRDMLFNSKIACQNRDTASITSITNTSIYYWSPTSNNITSMDYHFIYNWFTYISWPKNTSLDTGYNIPANNNYGQFLTASWWLDWHYDWCDWDSYNQNNLSVMKIEPDSTCESSWGYNNWYFDSDFKKSWEYK